MRLPPTCFRALLAALLCHASRASATTYYVTNTNNAGDGSLRRAIAKSNADRANPNRIEFPIEGSPPHIIELLTALPVIVQPVHIQGGSTPSITLQPANGVSINYGLKVTTGGCGFRGLVIAGFEDGLILEGQGGHVVKACQFLGNGRVAGGSAIRIENSEHNLIGGRKLGAGNLISHNGSHISDGALIITGSGSFGNQVQGNLIGTDAAGNQADGNVGPGVLIERGANRNFIGGTSAGTENVLSGNLTGVSIESADGNFVLGNFIGTDIVGQFGIPNTAAGVFIRNSSSNSIGAPVSGGGNFICASGASGIYIGNGGKNFVEGNDIGVGLLGQVLGNGTYGIEISASNLNVIGGTARRAANVIANNRKGVVMDRQSRNVVLRNSFHDNSELIAIDVGNDGWDSPPPELSTHYVYVSSAYEFVADDGTDETVLQVDLQDENHPHTNYRIEVFSTDASDAPEAFHDPTHSGQGREFLKAVIARTDHDSVAEFFVEGLPINLPAVVVTATRLNAADKAVETLEASNAVQPDR